MAKKKTTPKAGLQSPPEELFQPIGEEQQNPPSVEDRMQALQTTLSQLGDQLKESRSREERLQNLFLQLAAGGRQAPQADVMKPGTQPIGVDFSKLPDPDKDPAGYRAGLQQQVQAGINAAVEARLAPQRAAEEQAKKLNDLWSDFAKKYEDLAGFQDIAQIVAGNIVKQGIAAGSDANTVVFADRDGFMEKVANQMRERISAIRGVNEEEDDGEEAEDERPEPARTLGIPGGTPQRSGGKAPAKQTTMLDDLKDFQKGIYY